MYAHEYKKSRAKFKLIDKFLKSKSMFYNKHDQIDFDIVSI